VGGCLLRGQVGLAVKVRDASPNPSLVGAERCSARRKRRLDDSRLKPERAVSAFGQIVRPPFG
jgi:hypothetical protein